MFFVLRFNRLFAEQSLLSSPVLVTFSLPKILLSSLVSVPSFLSRSKYDSSMLTSLEISSSTVHSFPQNHRLSAGPPTMRRPPTRFVSTPPFFFFFFLLFVYFVADTERMKRDVREEGIVDDDDDDDGVLSTSMPYPLLSVGFDVASPISFVPLLLLPPLRLDVVRRSFFAVPVFFQRRKGQRVPARVYSVSW